MKIKYYRRVTFDEPHFGIHRDRCSCSCPKCGKEWRTTGWTFYIFGYAISFDFDKPKECDAPF